MHSTRAKALNTAARALLDAHVCKPVSQGWRYSNDVAVETICKTFSVAPLESEAALLKLLTPERLGQFPHNDLFDFAQALKFLGPDGDDIVLRLFEAAFGNEPQPGQWEQFGSAILPMTIQSSDQWNSVQYSLAEYYQARSGENAALMTEIACIAWNAGVRRREESRSCDEDILAVVPFRGVQCELVADYSHVFGRDVANEENRILSHFEKLLREWASAADTERLNAALNTIGKRNRTSMLWNLFMEVGAEHPAALGAELETILVEPTFLYQPEYSYAGTALLGALHKTGDVARRTRLEKLVIDLPSTVRSRRTDSWKDGKPVSWLQHAQDRLLGSLDEKDIVSAETLALRRERQSAGEFPKNVKRRPPGITSHTLSDEELIEHRGISLHSPANKELFRLREALKPFTGINSQEFDINEIERRWPIIQKVKGALKRHRKRSRRWRRSCGDILCVQLKTLRVMQVGQKRAHVGKLCVKSC